MKPLTLFLPRHGFRSHVLRATALRFNSTQSRLQAEMTARPPNIIYDYLSPTPSHLLNISLADFLPESCYPPNFTPSTNGTALPLAHPDIVGTVKPYLLPQGHHLVYFPPQIRASDLLPDGTDPVQSPGPPYVRRMWAGGSLSFSNSYKQQLKLDNTRAACIERVTGVRVAGSGEDEKVFVSIERRVGTAEPKRWNLFQTGETAVNNPRVQDRYQADGDDEFGQASIVEMRNIVFMKGKSLDAAKEDTGKISKVVKPPHAPDYSITLSPDQCLLFRFSALTFNAHAIHLDPEYCRVREGYRNLLVHGPLSLMLMLSVLRSQLPEGEMIRRFDYRNLAPVFSDDPLRVCIWREKDGDKYDVWVEGEKGGYAVKATATVEQQALV